MKKHKSSNESFNNLSFFNQDKKFQSDRNLNGLSFLTNDQKVNSGSNLDGLDFSSTVKKIEFPLNAQSIKPKVAFLHCCLNSLKIANLFFTNYIYGSMENYNDSIGINFENIFCNSEVVNKRLRLINLSLKNGKRINAIFSACINIDFKKYAIYESYITNEYTQVSDGVGKGKFRAFSVYDVENINSEKEESWLIVFLLDPHHLVCPVPTKGKSRDEINEIEYQKVKDFNCFLKELFQKKVSRKAIKKELVNWLD